MSPFGLGDRGRRRVGWNVDSQHNLGERWTCGTYLPFFVLWLQSTSAQMARRKIRWIFHSVNLKNVSCGRVTVPATRDFPRRSTETRA